jgi:hypothetical protein
MTRDYVIPGRAIGGAKRRRSSNGYGANPESIRRSTSETTEKTLALLVQRYPTRIGVMDSGFTRCARAPE